MKESKILFVPLGGGQCVGASCYYMRIGQCSVLLDCGIGMSEGRIFYPDFHTPRKFFVPSMGSVSQMYISHAHLDHVGGLMEFMNEAPHTPVYMTDLTLMLTEHQLRLTGQQPFVIERLKNAVTTVSFNRSFTFKDYKVSFYPAGHIPGAMMTLFEYGARTILYTGDYSVSSTGLTMPCVLPDKQIDILIICAVHARHAKKVYTGHSLMALANSINLALQKNASVLCHTSQLSKGVELLAALNELLPSDVNIYIDELLFSVIRQFEKVGVPIITARDHHLREDVCDVSPHVALSANRSARPLGENWIVMDANFTLHDGFDDTATFIKKINPKVAVVVHSPYDDAWDKTVEQELMLDSECGTQFLFPENGQVYLF